MEHQDTPERRLTSPTEAAEQPSSAATGVEDISHGDGTPDCQRHAHPSLPPAADAGIEDISQGDGTPDGQRSAHPSLPPTALAAVEDITEGDGTPDCQRHAHPSSSPPSDADPEVHEDLFQSEDDRNPEPPPELLGREDLISADNIGDTVFSKHWLFTTLMRLIQAVDAEVESKESTVTEGGVDIGDSLQDELCKLWDMSMNSAVVTFLQEFKAVDIFTGVVAKSRAPRATEICIGIFGNMACNEEASKEMAANKKLIDLVLLLLSEPDAPTLVETMRLLQTVVSNATHRAAWITAIKEKDSFLGDVMFILSSSTNNDLLRNTAMFLDKLLDVEEELCSLWGLPQLVTALLEAVKQTGEQSEALEAYLHIFQLLSTSEMGVTSLVTNADAVCGCMLQYLVTVCADEIVVVEGCENTIASVLSTLNVIITSSQQHHKYILQDYELVRCLLKILDVVYPKIHPEKYDRHQLRHHRRRRPSRTHRVSASETSPPHDDSQIRPRTDSVVRQDSGASDRGSVQENTPPKQQSNGNGHERLAGTPRKDPDVEYDKTRTKMLYEVLQGFSEDLIDVLNVEEALEDTPKALRYLDDQAPRHRLYHLVWTLQSENTEVNDQGHPEDSQSHPKVKALQHLAALYHLGRLERVVEDALSTQ